jgi:glucose-1-phosphate cytidylyltransferase
MSLNEEFQVVLLAGGLGTRIREETNNRPKPMIEIGGSPIIWHLMKNFSQFGIRRFVICAGYKAEVIVDYFSNYDLRQNNFTVKLGLESTIKIHHKLKPIDWEITVVHTGGPEIGTGGRLYRAAEYIDSKNFICTYGDGLSDVNVNELIDTHSLSGSTATVTVVNPTSRFGVVQIDDKNKVTTFKEKPTAEGWVNGGFFVFSSDIFNYLNDSIMLEGAPMQKLSAESKLGAYRHNGFWQAMDTFREYELLENLWQKNIAPWKNW